MYLFFNKNNFPRCNIITLRALTFIIPSLSNNIIFFLVKYSFVNLALSNQKCYNIDLKFQNMIFFYFLILLKEFPKNLYLF